MKTSPLLLEESLAIKTALDLERIEFRDSHEVILYYENGRTEQGNWQVNAFPPTKSKNTITFPICNTDFTFHVEQISTNRFMGKCIFGDAMGKGKIDLKMSK